MQVALRFCTAKNNLQYCLEICYLLLVHTIAQFNFPYHFNHRLIPNPLNPGSSFCILTELQKFISKLTLISSIKKLGKKKMAYEGGLGVCF